VPCALSSVLCCAVLCHKRCYAGARASCVMIRPLNAGRRRACRGEAWVPSGWVGSGRKIQPRYMPAAWMLISKRHARRQLHCGRKGHLENAHLVSGNHAPRPSILTSVTVARQPTSCLDDVALSALLPTKFSCCRSNPCMKRHAGNEAAFRGAATLKADGCQKSAPVRGSEASTAWQRHQSMFGHSRGQPTTDS